jgi:uncharacterized protein
MGELSVDTNILVYAFNQDSDVHDIARSFVSGLAPRQDVVIAELVLVELYLLLRNGAVFPKPLDADAAVRVCRSLRANPNWRIVECRGVMADVWREAGRVEFPRRRIIDVRLALTLKAAGVTEFATRNTADFAGLGFSRVFDPLVERSASG